MFISQRMRNIERYFYEMYPEILNRPQLGDDLENAIFFIPWGHNKVIIDKCKGDSAKALFYVKKTLKTIGQGMYS